MVGISGLVQVGLFGLLAACVSPAGTGPEGLEGAGARADQSGSTASKELEGRTFITRQATPAGGLLKCGRVELHTITFLKSGAFTAMQSECAGRGQPADGYRLDGRYDVVPRVPASADQDKSSFSLRLFEPDPKKLLEPDKQKSVAKLLATYPVTFRKDGIVISGILFGRE
jgi:hypothetical protein